MILLTVADAANLAACFVEALGLGQVLRHAEFKYGLKDAFASRRVPHVDPLLVIGGERARIRIVYYSGWAFGVLRVLNDCALAEFEAQVVFAVRAKLVLRPLCQSSSFQNHCQDSEALF